MDPEQADIFVGPDLGPNCLKRLSADDTSRMSLKFPLNAIKVSNSLDPEQARHIVGPDLGLNCLQRLNISRRH